MHITNRVIKLLFFAFLFCFLSFFYSVKPSYAADRFRMDYFVDYYLSEMDNNLATRVSYRVKMTNLTADLVIKNFSVIFPKSFEIGNIKATDDFTTVIPKVTQENDKHKISVDMSNPLYGLNESNNIYLDFLQQNLFKVNGGVWEVILPTLDKKDELGDYTVTVHLPPNSGKQLSISKPKPDHITLNEIVWKNPDNKTIYAVFGKQQNYSMELRYHLKNPRLNRVYTDVAFPPDTLYQKVFVSSIQPAPAEVTIDEDGNYLGRYYLNPKEEIKIYFKGGAVVSAEPREDMKDPTRTLFNKSQKYLLSTSNHWKLEESRIPMRLETIEDIYKHTTKTLSYNYGRLNSKILRLGALQAMQFPDQAVCTEYSDVFIALSREKGLYAREMQGYGFSSDQNLRPLSVNSDILHSWIEYYDTVSQLWIPIDPTWEDTSGIDYLNTFDLNHIVFAIHGKKSDYPYPAGSYKAENETKDINIVATADYFIENKSFAFEVTPFSIPTLNNESYLLKVNIKNKGNTIVWNLPINAAAEKLDITPSNQTVISLAPYEKKGLTFEYKPLNRMRDTKTKIILTSEGKKIYEYDVTVNSIYFTIGKYIAVGFAFAFGLLLALKLIRK